ncbi:tRNA-modifying protein YgfZ [Testudinibacter sp. TR-2022]|uniref:tRNA-modifying protein YgfZ n=1 Tax=Testudinibacter sp. TR-2022 TaxID=2585029 RepID=UPI00111A5031|nr:tRNA-modifying protein YgfZ [Testudinibacter sp. TR-2022]TNH08841.1 tRNA-modifying protein YgfZ [Pasteurellaceae bacterium Phil11]TNH25887.1 tRNA-modifying protein YgfZ [Testudinibacter sp. TR-2022]TNH28466.1 tRNA-modifying protein YgfZ [Testudinibacter sp. TR-2022]
MTIHCQYPLMTETHPNMVCELSHYQLIEVSGEDSEKFLQGQLTTDISKLAVGNSTLTAHCDPKGKVWSVFRLVRVRSQQFYFIIRNALMPTALEQLKKYAVFSKVSFKLVQDRTLIGFAGRQAPQTITTLSEQLPNAETPLIHADGHCLLYIEHPQPRWILISESAVLITPTVTTTAWNLLDIQDGIPLLTAESQNQFIPQAINLQLLEQTVSFHKGCYIGQETIARAKYRGANKRALFTLVGQSDTDPSLGQAVELLLDSNWRKTGSILNYVRQDGVLWLQVVLANDTESSQRFRLSEDSAQPLCLYPLPYTLEG